MSTMSLSSLIITRMIPKKRMLMNCAVIDDNASAATAKGRHGQDDDVVVLDVDVSPHKLAYLHKYHFSKSFLLCVKILWIVVLCARPNNLKSSQCSLRG